MNFLGEGDLVLSNSCVGLHWKFLLNWQRRRLLDGTARCLLAGGKAAPFLTMNLMPQILLMLGPFVFPELQVSVFRDHQLLSWPLSFNEAFISQSSCRCIQSVCGPRTACIPG